MNGKCWSKNGEKVKAKFSKCGVHTIAGIVSEACIGVHSLEGTWVSIKVTGGNMNDAYVNWSVFNKVEVLVSIKDVEIIK